MKRGVWVLWSSTHVGWSSRRSRLVEVSEDSADECGLDDESENFHPCSAAGAGQRVHLVDAVDELCPAFARSALGSRVVGFTVPTGRSGVVPAVGCANAVGVSPVEMDQVLVGLGDVDENAGQKLEGVDEGLVVDLLTGLGLVEQELGVPVIAKAGEVHRGPHEIAGELVESLGVAGIDGSSVVNAKTRIPPGQEKVDALLGDELAVSKKSEDLVPEDELGLIGVDVGDGMPRAVREEDAAGDEGMNVRVPPTAHEEP